MTSVKVNRGLKSINCLFDVAWMQKHVRKNSIHTAQSCIYSRTPAQLFFGGEGGLASSCQYGGWQTSFCCVCQRKWSSIDLRDSPTEHWTQEAVRWEREERERDKERARVTDTEKERQRGGEERVVCAVDAGGLKCPGLKRVRRRQGLITPPLLGNETKQQAQMYKL